MKIGIDIGGTKCAVVLGDDTHIEKKIKFATTTCEETLKNIIAAVSEIGEGDAIGISCGGPLDSKRGIIMSPPNLIDWDNVHITDMLSEKFNIPTYLCNDANACALAEWKYGAGKGTENMIFLTFGTGFGAGIILNGRLYDGASGMAGEIGHIRLSDYGPIGYGKQGSTEGFCSGGGIAQIGRSLALEKLQQGESLPYCNSTSDLPSINAKLLADYAKAGDKIGIEAYRICGEMLGKSLSILIDLLNPDAIVIGSIFTRAEELIRPHMERILERETLAEARLACKILPAALGESIGDFAALTVAFEGGKNK
ncbi:MAG: ROK family protein [Clostridia bacterium]|nr:ROK family protein [Clostridia bacterium]MBR4033532.1 ROK family protein [Clostridia bacterium]